MGRLLCAGAITATFAALAAIVITLMVARTGDDAARMPAERRPDLLRLRADDTIEPPLIRPGGRFRYGFQITNIGDVALRNVAVRSERAATNGPSSAVRVLSVSDRMCAINGQVNCLFPELPPGGSRWVRIEAVAPPVGPPSTGGAQLLVVRTFVGCFVPGPAGGVDFSVIGDAQESIGRLAAAPSRHDQADGPPGARDGAGGSSKDGAGGARRAGNGDGRGDRAGGAGQDQADALRRDRAERPQDGRAERSQNKQAERPDNGRAERPQDGRAERSQNRQAERPDNGRAERPQDGRAVGDRGDHTRFRPAGR